MSGLTTSILYCEDFLEVKVDFNYGFIKFWLFFNLRFKEGRIVSGF